MGLKYTRHKKGNLLLSFIYRAQKLLPLGSESKLKFFLNLEWIFDRLSHEQSFKHYQRDNHPIFISAKNFILKHLSPQHIVLDLGSNHGTIANFMADKAKEVIGIDYNEALVKDAQNRYSKGNLVFLHKEAYEYLQANPDKKFDVLILSHILEHLDNPEDFLKKFKNRFDFIYIELPDFEKTYLNVYRKDLKLDLNYTDDDHISEFDRDDMLALLKNCEVKVVESEYRYGIQRYWCSTN